MDKLGFKCFNFKICCLGIILIVAAVQTIKLCTDDDCSSSDCPQHECYHGNCGNQGDCLCDGCWQGASCNQQVNANVPLFVKSLYEVMIETPISVERPIVQVQAHDADKHTCATGTSCACAEMKYAIDAGNEEGTYRIDTSTGEIFLTEEFNANIGFGQYLTVSAENPAFGGEGSKGSQTEVYISLSLDQVDHLGMHGYAGFQASYDNIGYSEAIPESLFQSPNVHSRSKRAINTNLDDFEPLPENVTFHLEKTGISVDVAEVQVGTRVHFLLAIQIPYTGDATDMLVELFTPDNETTVMVLCNVVIEHVGSSLQGPGAAAIAPDSFTVVLEAKEETSYDYDRAIIDFGNVTNDGAAVNGTDEMLIIEWDAVMIPSDDTVHDEVYWVSAGAEYNDDTEIWVGQASFVANTVIPDTSSIPTFNMTGPAEIMKGASTVYMLDMYIPYATSRLYVEAFTSIDNSDHISVCSVMVVSMADHYSCIPKDYLDYIEYPAADCTCDSCPCNTRVRLDLGQVTNAGFNEVYDVSDTRITVGIVFYVSNASAVVSDVYTLSAAVQVGETPTEIWAGNVNVTVVDDITAAGVGEDPGVTLTTITDSPVVVEQSVVYDLTIDIPEESEGTYKLDILAPYNDSAARMKLCGITLMSKGVNVPCFTEQEPVYSSRDDSGINDRVAWNLGRIRNTGHRDATVDTTANQLVLRIVASVLNHTLNEDGESLWMIAGVDIDDTLLWVGSNTVTIASTNNASEASDAPEFNMTYAFGDENVAIGAATNVTLTITTQPNGFHTPMDMEIIMPFYDNAPIMKICKAEIISAGKNLPCFNLVEKNADINYTTKVNTSVEGFDADTPTHYDKAVLSLGTLSNTGSEAGEDDVQINYIVQVMDHPNATEGSTMWLSEGLSYTLSSIWVGQLELTATDAFQEYDDPSLEPTVHVTRLNDSQTDLISDDTLPRGLTAVYEIHMKIPPQSTANYVVRAAVSDEMSVCHMQVTEIGSNFPCMSIDDHLGNYTEFPSGYHHQQALIDFGPLSNVAETELTNDTAFDENSIKLQVIVKMSEDAGAGPHSLTMDVEYGSTVYDGLSPISLSTEDAAINTTDDMVPGITFYPSPVNENQTVGYEIAKGQTLLYHMDLAIPEGSENALIVRFMTPEEFPEALEICGLNVVHVGANIPCLKKQTFDDTFTSRVDSTYVDTRELDLGHVCQHTLVNDSSENLVRIEAVVRANLASDLMEGDTIWLSATVRINGDYIAVSQMNITLTITEEFNETDHDIQAGDITLNGTDASSAIEIQPGTIRDIDVLITVPPNASVFAYLDAQAAVNTSAIFTIHHIEVLSGGANVGCMAGNSMKEFNTTYNSTQGTTQMDYAVFDMGIITNSGTTYRKGTFEEEDNQLIVQLQIQMTDAEENLDGSDHALSIGLSMGDNVYILEKVVTVTRDFAEAPDILLEATMNESRVYGVGDVIEITALVYHTNESQAEGYNTTASFYFPPFMRFRNVTYSNVSYSDILNTTNDYGVSIVFGVLYFTDIAEFTIEIEVSPDDELPFPDSPVNSTSPYEAGSNIIHREMHIHDNGTWFVSRVDQLAFKIVGPTGIDCSAAPLGMQTGTVRDCQLTSSQSADTTNATDARLVTGSGWTVGIRGGDFTPYMQVYFANITRVDGVTIEHSSSCGPTGLEVKYSDGGLVWETLGYTLTVDPSVSPEYVEFPVAVEAAYIQLHITGHDCTTGVPTITAELHGCYSPGDVSITDICAARYAWGHYQSAAPIYSRGFLAADNYWYYCDENPSNSNAIECFMSTAGDTGTWVTVNEVVMNIIGYDSAEGLLYGIAWDKRTFMTSADWGETWYSVDDVRYTQASATSDWMSATEVPWQMSPTFRPSEPSAHYTSGAGGMGATYEGIVDGSTVVVSWEQCCN